MRNDHPKRQVPVGDKEMVRCHETDDEFRYIDSNASQKAIDDKRN